MTEAIPTTTLNLKNDDEQIISVSKAIASKTRWKILKILLDRELDISRLAEAMEQTEANVSAQVKHLEKAKLVTCRYEPGEHGVRKICRTNVDRIEIHLTK